MVEIFPISWLDCELLPLATRAGLARPANTYILFLPAKKCGLALLPLVRLHKKLQATKMVQLFRSHYPALRKAAVSRLTD